MPRSPREVAGPPKIAEGKIIVWSLDGKIYALSEERRQSKWFYTGTSPPLTVRRFVGGSVARGALFTGTAGGKLLAFDVNTGTLGWEASVATPKGATELERIADVTSLPLVDERQVCAAAYQGRVACFEVLNGNAYLVARSLQPRRHRGRSTLSLSDRRQRCDACAGQDRPARRSGSRTNCRRASRVARCSSATAVGVVDVEGYLHLLDRERWQRLSAASPPTAARRCRSQCLRPSRPFGKRRTET